ncbi:hypothetical protein OQA88_13423 [Cercophora sp. LCS_1]
MHFSTIIIASLGLFVSGSLAQRQIRPTGDVDGRRIDYGTTHTPPACPDTGGLGIGDDTNSSPDEFPFASLAQGGRTPFGDGASILCVTINEQRSQGGKGRQLYNGVAQGGKGRQLYNGVAQGEDFELALQDTTGM